MPFIFITRGAVAHVSRKIGAYRKFRRELQKALEARGLTLQGIATDGSPPDPRPILAVFGPIPHLLTNDRELRATEVRRASKRQPLWEKRSSQFETDLAVAPVFLKDVSRIQGLLAAYLFGHVSLKTTAGSPLTPDPLPERGEGDPFTPARPMHGTPTPFPHSHLAPVGRGRPKAG